MLDFDVEPGEHFVRVTISWTGSRKVAVTVRPGECVALTTRPRSPFTALFDLFSRTRWISLAVDEPQSGSQDR